LKQRYSNVRSELQSTHDEHTIRFEAISTRASMAETTIEQLRVQVASAQSQAQKSSEEIDNLKGLNQELVQQLDHKERTIEQARKDLQYAEQIRDDIQRKLLDLERELGSYLLLISALTC